MFKERENGVQRHEESFYPLGILYRTANLKAEKKRQGKSWKRRLYYRLGDSGYNVNRLLQKT